VKSTFVRAANIIREATEVEGVTFFDASIGTFGGLVEAGPVRKTSQPVDAESKTLSSANKQKSFDASPSLQAPAEEIKNCGILSCSVVDAFADNTEEAIAFQSRTPMAESLLRSLLQRYPRGKIFTFDEARPEANPVNADRADAVASDENKRPNGTTLTTKRRQAVRQEESESIRSSFPRARSLILSPLWDSHRSRYYAAIAIWTTNPVRVFTHEGELSYLVAFGNSIMAEVARLDAAMADRAKGDFISSVSHELRSPLHGILGSAELMNDTKLDPFQ